MVLLKMVVHQESLLSALRLIYWVLLVLTGFSIDLAVRCVLLYVLTRVVKVLLVIILFLLLDL